MPQRINPSIHVHCSTQSCRVLAVRNDYVTILDALDCGFEYVRKT